MGRYLNMETAIEDLKDETVYTIVDLEKGIKGPTNLIFNTTDFSNELECLELLEELRNGNVEVSKRHGAPFEIEKTTMSYDK